MGFSPPGRISESLEIQSSHWTESERAAIRQELSRLLSSPIFINSKRCASLLRFVVDYALDGKTDHLKERTLGIDVFQREPDYDTNRDPVVRTTAVEIRKRIAQYYATAEHEGEIRISFPAGSYVPEFRMPTGWVPAKLPEIAPDAAVEPASRTRGFRWITLRWIGWTACAALAALAVYLLMGRGAASALDRFWAPVMASAEPALLLIGGPEAANSPPQDPPVTVAELQTAERVAFADAATLSRITGVMMKNGKTFHIRRHGSAKLEDLREGPVVLIGAFNNGWTLRLTDQVRYRFVRDAPTHTSWIADRENPAARTWRVNTAEPYRSVVDDYALVSRVLDPTTGRLVVTAAGLTKFGTAAAGEFLSEPGYMEEALRSAPKGWDARNLQIVLATKLVGESSGPPRVIATHFW